MLKVLDSFKLDEQGVILYCRDDEFNNMSKTEVGDYISKIDRIKVYDKNSNTNEFTVKKYDIMQSLSDKISVALLIDKLVAPDSIKIPSEITIIK